MEDTQRSEDSLDWTADQLQTWQIIRRVARPRHVDSDQGSAKSDDPDLEDRFRETWMLLIIHVTGAPRYRSPY